MLYNARNEYRPIVTTHYEMNTYDDFGVLIWIWNDWNDNFM